MGSGDEKTGSGEGSASGAGEVRVRKATGEDIAALAQSMAGAFQDDPVMAWCFPEPEERAAILPEIARHCDAAGIPAYLEATGERNRRLYLRYGFTDMGDVTVPGGGPTVRQMWRTPRPPSFHDATRF